MIVPLAQLTLGALEPLQVVPITVATSAYFLRTRTLAAEGRAVPVARQISYYAAMLVIVAALASPLGTFAGESVLAHTGEHLLVGDLAPLLVVLGLTGPVLQPLLRLGWFNQLRKLAHPLIALPLWAINMYLWHLPLFYEASLHNEAVHALEHGLFFAFGVNMWMPLFGPLPMPAWFGNIAKLGYIVIVRVIGVVLGNVFVWSNTVFYADYANARYVWGLTPLSAQSYSGALMMIEGSVVTLCLFAWLFFSWARQSEESQQIVELAEAHGVPLTQARSDRAVAAGRGEQLRQKIKRSAETPESS